MKRVSDEIARGFWDRSESGQARLANCPVDSGALITFKSTDVRSRALHKLPGGRFRA